MSRAERSRRGGRDAEAAIGFALQLELRPGLPLAECRRLERRLEDYAEAQDLHIEGTQLHHVVSAPGRPVGVDDQVALLDWLVDQSGVVAVRLGPIGTLQSLPDTGGAAGQGDAAFIHVHTVDVALIGVTLLYRCARITPTLYLQILGGYVRPAQVH
jgi:hypothetical protein